MINNVYYASGYWFKEYQQDRSFIEVNRNGRFEGIS